MMKDIKVPGVLWAVLIIIVVALIHMNTLWILTNTPLTPMELDFVLALLIGILKSGTLHLETAQLNTALDVISQIEVPQEGTRGMMVNVHPSILTLERPNKVKRWLLG